MKKLVLICLTLCVMSGTVKSTNNNMAKSESVATVSISGQVLDHITGEALAGVKVNIDESKSSVYTDFEGNFVINGLLPASYTVSLSMISYEETKLSVDLEGDKPKDAIRVNLEQVTE